MNNFFKFFIFILSVSFVKTFAEEKKLEFLSNTPIIYSANLLGEIEPCGCRMNPTGGLERRYEWQTKNYDSKKAIIIESGNTLFSTSPIPEFLKEEYLIKAKTIINAYNTLGVHAFNVGNIETALGEKTLLDFQKQAKFKFLSSNLIFKKNKKLVFDPYLILERENKKIGIFGLLKQTSELNDDFEVLDLIESAKKAIQDLKEKNVDYIIALTNLGLDSDIELAKKVDGINFIFGSGSLSFLEKPIQINKTFIFQPDLRGQHIGVLINGMNSFVEMNEKYDAQKPNPISEIIKNSKKNLEIYKKNLNKKLFKTGTKK